MLRLVLACVLLTLFCLPLHAADRLNVLFIVSDDQRTDTIAALGNDRIQTPALDSLVKAGTTFTNAYCMGSMHGAVCMPSRAMFNSGRSLFRVHNQLEGMRTWGETMAAAGYETFATGKWHNGQMSAARSFERASSVFFGGMGDQLALPIVDKQSDGSWGNKRTLSKFSSEQFVDAAVEFLQTRDKSRPFFAYVSFTVPHDPRMPQGRWATMYDPAAMKLPPNFLPIHPFHNGWMTGRDEALLPWPRAEAAVKKEIAAYYGMISNMDAQVARLLETLDRIGQRQRTLIVFTSDHGLALGSHGLLGKQSLYDHSMHAPLIMAGPGIPRGAKAETLCYLFDIFPTVAELVGAEPPREIDGVSLAPALTGDKVSGRDAIFTAYMDLQRAVRTDRWKLIRYPKLNKSQLFDLKADPHETNDLAGDPGQAEQLKRMTALLEQQQKRFGDALPLTTDNPASPEFIPPRAGEPIPPAPNAAPGAAAPAKAKGKGKKKG